MKKKRELLHPCIAQLDTAQGGSSLSSSFPPPPSLSLNENKKPSELNDSRFHWQLREASLLPPPSAPSLRVPPPRVRWTGPGR